MISRTTGELDPQYGLSSTDKTNIYAFATMKFPKAQEDEIPDDKLDEVLLPYINKMKEERGLHGIVYDIPQVGPDDPSKFPKVKLPENIMM